MWNENEIEPRARTLHEHRSIRHRDAIEAITSETAYATADLDRIASPIMSRSVKLSAAMKNCP
jgi:hypothetical protein